jgi:hypothetical protein
MLIPSFQSLITAYWADEYSQRSGFAGGLSQLGNNPAERRSELGEVHENGLTKFDPPKPHWPSELAQNPTLQEKDFAYAKRIASCDVYIVQGFIALATLLASEVRGHVHRDSVRDNSSTIRFSVLLSDP